MSDHDALLAAVLADPAEDTARLVYADWLTENGEADRGEFIRIEVELAQTPPTTEADERRRKVLLERRTELLKEHRINWFAPFLPHFKDGCLDRGFVGSVEVSAETFLMRAPSWYRTTPLTRLKIANSGVWEHRSEHPNWWLERLFLSHLLGPLGSLELEQVGLTADEIKLLTQCPDLGRLRELTLPWNEIRTEGAQALAAMPQLKHLESLDVAGNGITDAGGRALAQSPYLGNLKELRITRNPFRSKRTWTMLELRFGSALVG